MNSTTGNNFANTLLQLLSQPEPNINNIQILDMARLVTASHREYLSSINSLIQLMNHGMTPLDMTIDLSSILGRGLAQGQTQGQTQGLTDDIIQRHTTTTIYSSNQPLNTSICPITLEPFREGDSITKIETCGHIFKTAPITEWLRRHDRCPMCRGRVV